MGPRLHALVAGRDVVVVELTAAKGRLLLVPRRPGAALGRASVDGRARLGLADGGVRARGARLREPHATARELVAGLVVLAANGQFGLLLELRVPLPERVAVPRHLRAERRHAELGPDLEWALHVLAFRQRDRRPWLLEAGVD